MRLIDLHCDTITEIMKNNKECNFINNSYCIDINKLKKSNSIAQFFALFINQEIVEERKIDIYNYTKECYNYFLNIIRNNNENLSFTLSYKDYMNNMKKKKISAFLTIEEGEVLQGDINRLNEIYNWGVRLLTLTWNFENCIGYPNSTNNEIMNKGLKPFGIEVIDNMNKLGMIIDVSHLSDGGFYDVARYSKKPFVASHSNARSINYHTRNLKDDMIKIISNRGGVIGINFYPLFLGSNIDNTISTIVRHIKHIKNIGGIDCIALGSDFDGFEGTLEIANIGEMHKLMEELRKNGFNDNELEKIWHINIDRLIKDLL